MNDVNRKMAEALAHRQRQNRQPPPTHKVTLKYHCVPCDKGINLEQPWSRYMPMPVQVMRMFCMECAEPSEMEFRGIERAELSGLSVPLIVPPKDIRSA